MVKSGFSAFNNYKAKRLGGWQFTNLKFLTLISTPLHLSLYSHLNVFTATA
jgi:hypothetical protein